MSDPAIKIPCDVCEREFTPETYAAHRCVTPCNRALDAMRGAIEHGNLALRFAEDVESVIRGDVWRRAERLAGEAREAFGRAAVAINEAAKVTP